MTDTDRMRAWLRDTLDAAQADAEAAAKEEEADWSDGGEHGETVTTVQHGSYVAVGPWDCPLPDGVRRHIARHDPAAVLRRIAADRQILELHAQAHECSSWDEVAGDFNTCQWVNEWETCSTVRLLAEGWGWTEETT